MYTVYADYGPDSRVTQATIALPDHATFDDVGDALRLLFRAATLDLMNMTERDRSLANTKILKTDGTTPAGAGYSTFNYQ